MHSRSNISTTLRKKRHASLRKKIVICSIFVLFFISLCILGLTTKEVRIKDIKVSGNLSVSSENVLNIVDTEINKNYLNIIPTSNIFLLRQTEIKNNILNNYLEINSVKIEFKSIDKIVVVVTERQPTNLWCKGIPSNIGNCYFMDSGGFIFNEAPTFSNDTMPKYLGLITDNNPIGSYYIKSNFKNISDLYGTLKRISFTPIYFNVLDEHEYEIYISSKGKILMNDNKSFQSQLVNLQALVTSNYIKNDTESLKKIKFIDLRFGNKVNFQLY